ncbi:hypothetical protein KUH03_32700 [Sphingobacterium sp. E70]|uniref:hypothetical protein n=1 Tax=Sphingobacterium sp. E70 TaxID=2853439 RepID=UPI00211CAF31|nr:hypothetical protein [Sphingobacterium sp. E70]ULT23853.1 hypothetical protein KUH03_32700 [Sphingobacterium sp. E70]
MHFALKGRSRAAGETLAATIDFETCQHNILYGNSICGQMQWEREEFQLCEINLSLDFFKKFLPDNSILFNDFRNIIEKGKSGLLTDINRRITHEMHALIDSIINCERKGCLKNISRSQDHGVIAASVGAVSRQQRFEHDPQKA